MMSKERSFYLLASVILAFSLFFRLYQLTTNPPALFSDELDAGYQAYIFNHCGTDYFGNKNPIHFHSVSDWRTSLYIYSIAFTQKIIGFSELSVRLPSVVYGILFSIVLSLIIYEIFHLPSLSLLGLAYISISPWQIHYSRVGFEVSGMLFFLSLGLYFWIKYLQKSKLNFLIFSLLSLITTAYFYSTAKLFIIILLPLIFFLWPDIIRKLSGKKLFLMALLVFLFSSPLIIDTLSGKAGYRFSYINIFSDPTVSKNVDYNRFQDAIIESGPKIGLTPSLSAKVLHNKLTVWSSMFFRNYFSAFSTEFLFLKGDSNLRHGFSQKGYLLYPDIIFLIVGISYVLSNKQNRILKFILFSLFLAPLPFSLTRDSLGPHATRLILMSPFLTILIISGFYYFIVKLKREKNFLLICLLYLFCFIDFFHYYFYHYRQISARSWHAGMKTAVAYALNQDSRLFFSNKPESFLPFFLFYSRYQPADSPCAPLQSFRWEKDQPIFQSLSKYYFANIEWPVLLEKYPYFSNTIFVVAEPELSLIESHLSQYNQQKLSPYKLVKIQKIDKQYTEQEIFYLIRFI